jgi:PmbA protein
MAGGATAAECVVREGDEFSTLVRLGQVETLKESGSRSIGVRVFRPARRQHILQRLFPDSLDRMVKSALELSKITSEDPFGGIPEASQLGSLTGDLDLYHEDVYSLPGPDRIDYARRAEKAALDFDPRIKNSEGGSFDAATGHKVLANSHGFVGEYRRSYCSVAAVPIAQTEDGAMQRDYLVLGREHAQQTRISRAGRQSRRRAHAAPPRRAQGEDRHRSRSSSIPWSRSRSSSTFSKAMNGDSVYRGASFLAGKLGTENRRRQRHRHRRWHHARRLRHQPIRWRRRAHAPNRRDRETAC